MSKKNRLIFDSFIYANHSSHIGHRYEHHPLLGSTGGQAMPNRAILFTGLLLLLALIGSVLSTRHYHRLATDWKNSARQSQQALTTANTVLAVQKRQQQHVAALDKQHTEELAHAKTTIEDLRNAVATGSRRLQFNSIGSVPVRNGATRTSSVVDAAQPRFTDAAKRHYFDLRYRIAIADQQITGLQEYIRLACLKSEIQ